MLTMTSGDDTKLKGATASGKQVTANNIALKADNQVDLLAQRQTNEEHSTNKSSSASVGVSIGSSGVMFNVSGSGSRGKGDGSDTSYANTHVIAANQLAMTSGGDTNIRGGNAAGKQVTASVGGDLNIESLQETSYVEADNRQLHQSERDFAKQNAKKFAQFYQEKTGQIIDEKRAKQMLLGDAYRMVDAAANKGPGVRGPAGDAVVVSFIAQNANGLFKATAAEYNNPFMNGNKNGALMPEQAALPGAVGNPAVGLATAGLVTGGAALGGAGTAATITGAVDIWTAYRAAQATYSVGTALGTGVAAPGTTYTLAAFGGAVQDKYLGNGQPIASGFDQRFSYPGLSAAMTVGALTGGYYKTPMLGWAGVPNNWTSWFTAPGFVIQSINTALAQSAGHAALAIVNANKKP